MSRTPYEILGVSSDATAEEIRSAFKAKAKTLHPDAGGGTEAFAEVSAAYDILKDPERRKRYDRTGDTTRTNIEAEATELISSLMQSIVMGQDDLTRVNVVKRLRVMIEEPIAAQKKKIALAEQASERAAKRLASMRGRFVGKADQPNFLEDMLDVHVRLMERGKRSIEQMREELKPFLRALEMVADYDYRPDPEPVWVQPSDGGKDGYWSNQQKPAVGFFTAQTKWPMPFGS